MTRGFRPEVRGDELPPLPSWRSPLLAAAVVLAFVLFGYLLYEAAAPWTPY